MAPRKKAGSPPQPAARNGTATRDTPLTEPPVPLDSHVPEVAAQLYQHLRRLMREDRYAARPNEKREAFPLNVRPWTVAIYMVADGPSGNAALDLVARKELDAIYDAARGLRNVHVAVQ